MRGTQRIAMLAAALAAVVVASAALVWGPAILHLRAEPALPPGDSTGAVELLLQDGPPPVEPRDAPEPMPMEISNRPYFTYPLNADRGLAYFIESDFGAHSVRFVLIDCQGKFLLMPNDGYALGGDRIDIVRSSHGGYHDLVCSYGTAGNVEWWVWQFDGTRYDVVAHGNFGDSEEFQALIDGKYGGTLAFCEMESASPPSDGEPD
jgi:hypothetical protein